MRSHNKSREIKGIISSEIKRISKTGKYFHTTNLLSFAPSKYWNETIRYDTS